MEKDNFLDRTEDTTIFKKIKKGDTVLICEKYMQQIASTLDDLTYGKVVEVLTHHDHPRGIKVKIRTPNDCLRVGRVVYIVIDGRIQTNES